MSNHIALAHRKATTAVVAGLLALTLPAALSAQSAPADPRWQGWIGCWRPAPAPSTPDDQAASLGIPAVDANAPLLCVVPAEGASAVEMVTVADGRVVARETIDASGAQLSRERDGCAGVESARWSADARRVYLTSKFTCPGDLERTSKGLLAISTEGELLDVQGVSTGSGKSVRVARYRDAGAPATLPASIARAVDGRAMAVGASRTAASAPITEAEIVDASRNLDAPVVQAWLIESGQRFSVDAKTLLRLAKAGVPGDVTDVMVALSYPKVFAVNRATFAGDIRALEPGRGGALAGSGRTIYADVYPPNVGGYYNGYGYPYYYGYSPLGYSPFGYSPFGYGGYGGFGGYPYGSVPVIIVRSGAEQRHGKVVKGQGYTRNDPPSTSGASSSSDRQPRSQPASSGSSDTRSSGSSSSGGERKAKPRP
jgi:hypothetical protein